MIIDIIDDIAQTFKCITIANEGGLKFRFNQITLKKTLGH